MNGDSFDYPTTQDEGGGWLLSYADLITLLVTFFVMMLSTSTVQRNRFDLLREQFSQQHTGDLTTLQKQLDQFITEEGIAQTVSTRLDQNGLSIQFTNTVLFDSGKAALLPDGRSILDRMTRSLVALPGNYNLVVEGYTDDVPIHNDLFHSNWELSSSRAIGVLQALIETGFDAKRVSVQGFADTRPAVPGDGGDREALTAEMRRSLNRRVVIRVY